jgi:hypothetical protein
MKQENAMNPTIAAEQTWPKPVCTQTLTRPEAQALMDAYGIPQGCPEQEEIQELQKTNPDLLAALTTIDLLRQFGKSAPLRPRWIEDNGVQNRTWIVLRQDDDVDVTKLVRPRWYRRVYLWLRARVWL